MCTRTHTRSLFLSLSRTHMFVCLFVCLFVEIKPEKLYSAFCVWREVNPLGVLTRGQRHRPSACQRQRYRPRTCQSMVNTLQVDWLARISGLTPAPTPTHPQSPNGVPPCLPHAHEWLMSHINGSCHEWMSHITYDVRSCARRVLNNKVRCNTPHRVDYKTATVCSHPYFSFAF